MESQLKTKDEADVGTTDSFKNMLRNARHANRTECVQDLILPLDKGGMLESPIRAAWILHGNPKARSKILSDGSSDGSTVTYLWECTGGCFDWNYDVDETVYVLAGSVTLTFESGASCQLVAGNTHFFPRGTRVQWSVEGYILKLAFCHSPGSVESPGRLAEDCSARNNGASADSWRM